MFQTGSADERSSGSGEVLPPLHLLSFQPGNNGFRGRLFAAFNHGNAEVPPLSEFNVLPWSCDCERFWRDLGEGHFPRYVKDARCGQRTCWFGHFDCIQQKYEVNVLKQIQPNDFLGADIRSSIFEEDFMFITVNVTVNCFCGRSTGYS